MWSGLGSPTALQPLRSDRALCGLSAPQPGLSSHGSNTLRKPPCFLCLAQVHRGLPDHELRGRGQQPLHFADEAKPDSLWDFSGTVPAPSLPHPSHERPAVSLAPSPGCVGQYRAMGSNTRSPMGRTCPASGAEPLVGVSCQPPRRNQQSHQRPAPSQVARDSRAQLGGKLRGALFSEVGQSLWVGVGTKGRIQGGGQLLAAPRGQRTRRGGHLHPRRPV